MRSKVDDPETEHSHGEPCEAGRHLYAAALRAGRIARSEVDAAPCLLDLALLHPDPDDPDWLRPVPPSIALNQLIHPIEREIQQRRQRALSLADAFEPFMTITTATPRPPRPSTSWRASPSSTPSWTGSSRSAPWSS